MVSISPPQPAWSEVLVGLSTFAVLMFVFALGFSMLPADQPILQGVVGSTAGGIAGTGAFAAAAAIRIRALRPFGFRPVPTQWLLTAAMLGMAGYGITYLIQSFYAAWFGHGDPRAILHAAARGGVVPFLASLVGGAVLTPFGEEVLFRGVVANAWRRHGAWASVGASSVVFGIAHGVSIILPIAIMVGILSAVIFHRAGSIWLCVVLHGVYNGSKQRRICSPPHTDVTWLPRVPRQSIPTCMRIGLGFVLMFCASAARITVAAMPMWGGSRVPSRRRSQTHPATGQAREAVSTAAEQTGSFAYEARVGAA